ncbi:tetratricopeptide repeat-containing sensor histidine kinase [Fulvivirgaceae bacterium BMA12]|uniref:histidine kinase n=1 Tax=Agaribacillus aureus TaxID=3051825 RepID=A0ABT8KYV1_9BACT|nr:tetratricopeptide repeat-containing sensor histidine kinase [Fulvivirgaceae bacterium BMA12]
MGQIQQLSPKAKIDPAIKEKVQQLVKSAYHTRIKDVNESLLIIEKARNLSLKYHYQYGVDVSEAYKGFFLMILGDFKTSLKLSKALLDKFQEDHLKAERSVVLYTIGSVYYKSDNYHVGLQHLLECLSLRRELDDKLGESQVLKAIGTIYEFFNDYESAEEVYERCFEISQSINDKLGESNACNPLSGIYLKRGKYEKALDMANRSITLKEAGGDTRGLAFAYHAKAKVFLRTKEFEKAEKWFLKSLKLQRQMGEKMGEGMCELKLGELYLALDNYAKAKIHLHHAIAIGEGVNSKLILFKGFNSLYLIAKKENDAPLALKYLERHLENKESVINTGTGSIIKSLKAMAKIEMLEREARIIKEKNSDIEKKNTELDTFVYRVSHDLRGPIASLLGLYNIARYDIKDTLSKKYLDMYHEQIMRLNNIILDLINLTRIKGWQVKNSKIEFSTIVQSIIKSFEYLPNFPNIKFNLDIDETIEYYSDKSIITTVFQNLIENSIKYSRVDISPVINVVVARDSHDDFLLIEVRDNGIGIGADYQERIFEMFFRANDEKEGSGLGLYILKYAVDKLNGKIKLKSERGEGSTFSIVLPF